MWTKVARGALGASVVFLLVTNPVVVEAAGQITSSQIKNSSIKSKDVKNNQLKGADVRDGSLTGADIDESTLSLPREAASMSVAGFSFTSRDFDTSISYVGESCVFLDGSPGVVTYRLDLPQGARISAVSFRLTDNDGGESRVSLTRYDVSIPEVFEVQSVATVGAAPGLQTVNLAPNAVVDNTRNSYHLQFSAPSNSAHELCGATVTYA